MAANELPLRPNLEFLKNQARALLDEYEAASATASERFQAAGVTGAPKLADALHVVAREYGFATWPALKMQVEAGSEQPVAALVAALKANDAEALRAVLARWPELPLDEPLADFGYDAPPLLVGVEKDSRAMVEVLLAGGADVNARSRWWAGGFGALEMASPGLAEYLIARGAVVDIHAAARLGRADRVRELLAGAAGLVHARGGDGQLPLHYAATVEIAAMLLEAGAEIDARDVDHESTALQYMVSMKPERHEVARYLIGRGAEVDLLAAAAVGDRGLAERILNDDPETIQTSVSERSFPKVNPRSGGSIYFFGFGTAMTPHLVARRYGHEEVFALLMQRSAPAHRLVLAAEMGDEAMAREILERHPAAVEKLNSLSVRRILGPAVRSNTRAVAMLLEYGWPATAATDKGQTALHFAAMHGNVAMAKALLARGAEVNAVESEHDSTPMGFALWGSLHGWLREQGDYPGMVRTLLAAGATRPEGERVMGTKEVLAALGAWGPAETKPGSDSAALC